MSFTPDSISVASPSPTFSFSSTSTISLSSNEEVSSRTTEAWNQFRPIVSSCSSSSPSAPFACSSSSFAADASLSQRKRKITELHAILDEGERLCEEINILIGKLSQKKRRLSPPTSAISDPLPPIALPLSPQSHSTGEWIPQDLSLDLLARPQTRCQNRNIQEFVTKHPKLFHSFLRLEETANPHIFKRTSGKKTTCHILSIDPIRRLPNELEIHQLPIVGHGIFAKTHLPAGSFLSPYAGITQLETPETSVPTSAYIWELARHVIDPKKDPEFRDNQIVLSIDAQFKGNYIKYINSSETSPNVEAVLVVLRHLDRTISYQVFYRVLKPIEKGEQLLIAYGRSYWENIEINPLELTPKTYIVMNGKVFQNV